MVVNLPHLIELYVFVISVIITGSTTLRVLDVSGNEIGDDGISMISEELQRNKALTELLVARCGLSVKGEKLINFVFLECR